MTGSQGNTASPGVVEICILVFRSAEFVVAVGKGVHWHSVRQGQGC